MKKSNSVYVEGSEIIKNGGAIADIYMDAQEYIFVTGKVYSPDKEVLPNVAVAITLIDKNTTPPIETFLGVTFSNEEGTYGVSLLWKNNYEYKFVPYCGM
jgi:hypothetical protein